MNKKTLTLAFCGCGSRSRTYAAIAQQMPGNYELVAGADPIAAKVDAIANIANHDNFQKFHDAEELLAQPQLADIMVVGTQDNYHTEPVLQALAKGYHVLLEKPAAQTMAEVQQIFQAAQHYQRHVILCFVLRYTPFYQAIKQVITSGKLGDIVTINATEGVGTFHQAHSFVRGHWSRAEDATPMIVAKCCHDTDLLAWLIEKPYQTVHSVGELSYFQAKNKPQNAPEFCLEGCPQNDNCSYNAALYLDKYQRWLDMVYPDVNNYTHEDGIKWLKTSPWGRCVYQCDNDVVDHQISQFQFSNGVTASLTMTAFDTGRNITIYGTNAVLKGGDSIKKHTDHDFIIEYHDNNHIEKTQLPDLSQSGYHGHGGGDYGLMKHLPTMLTAEINDQLINSYLQGHQMAFDAEKARQATQ